ncbi:VHS1063 protein [Vibrio phage 1]|nr:VHS1063 protein [Vibrio phage 1]
MAIQPSQLAIFKAERNNDQNTNGGRSTLTKIASGVRNGIFSDLQSGASLGGSVESRKVFIKQDINAPTADAYNNAFVYMTAIGDPGVFIDLFYGTQTDTQGQATFSTIMVGRVTAINTVLNQITLATLTARNTTMKLARYRPSNSTMQTLDNATVAKVDSTTARIDGLSHTDFQIGDIITEVVLVKGNEQSNANDLKPRAHSSEITAGGTLDLSAVSLAPKAAISIDVNLTFVNTQAYNYSIPSLGLTGSGNISTDLNVYHPDSVTNSTENLLLSIPSTAWGGAWTNASRVTFKVESGSIPVWLRRTIAANPSLSGQQDVNFALEYQTS